MYYVLLTALMLFSDGQHGVLTATPMLKGALPAINQQATPPGSRAQYMARARLEQSLILFHCTPNGYGADKITLIYSCGGM